MLDASRDADIVFIGLAISEPDGDESFAGRLQYIVSQLRTTVFVKCAESFTGQLIELK
ncbi:hypothetical protein KAR48_01100 [bacterium]|nr:hypothetical protein [bacterium]